MRIDILLTGGKRLRDRIISRRGGFGYKASLISPLFIELSVPRKESDWSCICVLGLSILSLFLGFEHIRNCSKNAIFVFIILSVVYK